MEVASNGGVLIASPSYESKSTQVHCQGLPSTKNNVHKLGALSVKDFEDKPYLSTSKDDEVDRKHIIEKEVNGDSRNCKASTSSQSIMDQDLEFYPIDEFNSSPSTFTAWDAFMTSNQAFFREPCYSSDYTCTDSFSYMDVIPEEDDVSVLESDTDDTGSSVSTVIDKFSRTSTANSSFSERIRTAKEDPPIVAFDLEQVLSPFEELEKELDEDESIMADRETSPRNGPIVIVTTPVQDLVTTQIEIENDTFQTGPSYIPTCQTNVTNVQLTSRKKLNFDSATKIGNQSKISLISTCESKESVTDFGVSKTIIQVPGKPVVTVTPPLPSRLSNRVVVSSKNRKDTSEKSSPPFSTRKRDQTYQTPTVPPRMSKHLAARRTRSDPGSTDSTTPPSRIPRPTFATRSLSDKNTRGIQKSSSKAPSPKLNRGKSSKLPEPEKSNSNGVVKEVNIKVELESSSSETCKTSINESMEAANVKDIKAIIQIEKDDDNSNMVSVDEEEVSELNTSEILMELSQIPEETVETAGMDENDRVSINESRKLRGK